VVTGRVVERLRYHSEIVRDLSWHPTLPLLVTTSFDGTLIQWEPEALHLGEDGRPCQPSRLPEAGQDPLEDNY
jgi:WD repeat-containing protein 23